jgi:hypothetical protein
MRDYKVLNFKFTYLKVMSAAEFILQYALTVPRKWTDNWGGNYTY